MQTNSSETPPTVNELYLHLHTVNHDGVTFIDTRSERFYDKLQRRRLELTQATPDQPVDDEAVYLNVAGECPKGRVYGLGSLGRKKRRYADLGASTSQMPEMVSRAEFDIVTDQLRKVMAFMHQQFGMTMDGAGLSQPQPPPPPPPPPPHDQQQSPQIDPADPPQQGDNLTVDVTFACLRSRIEANLAGSIVQLLGLVGDAITSAEANIFSELCNLLLGIIVVLEWRRRESDPDYTDRSNLDDEAVHYKVAGDCPKGCVYSLRSLWRKKRRYVDPDASTSQVLAQRGMSNFMILRDGYNNSVSDPLLIRDGSETEYNNSVSDPLLIRDGSETESNNSVSDPLLIRDEQRRNLIISSLIRC
ncbi:hypothetical protein Scep_014662 [Stephania cephalantha]|uniref:Uncharacterized protein n=1 Tax=Stephania cephalantha TaxID=152367 RepID=A0AAP0P389_9MAGN